MRSAQHREATSGTGGPAGGTDPSVFGGSETTGATLTDCLNSLGLKDHDLLSFGVEPLDGKFKGSQKTVEELRRLDMTELRDCNVWVGLQPVRKAAGRGTSNDVERIVALPADLDVGENKIPTDQGCMDVIDALSSMMGTKPVYVVASGHGYQPVWAVDPEDASDLDRMRPLLTRWGNLVQQVAVQHGGSADSVFDPARLLRAPGGINWKDAAKPVPTSATLTGGTLLSADQIAEALDAYLHEEVGDEGDDDFEIPQVATTCRYAKSMVAAWADDVPDERHPWAVRGAMKLACLRRLGCITDKDFATAREVMVNRMTWLCAQHGQAREFHRDEVEKAVSSAIRKTKTMPLADMRQKVGHHDHREPQDLTWTTGTEDGTDAVGPKRSDKVPAVHPSVYHGVVGEYVSLIAPTTESDPMAVLAQALAWAGCRIGRSVWIQFGNARQYPLIWPLIVGQTSTGRKGNSEQDSLSSLSSLSPLPRRRSGLSSGEGLIEAWMAKGDQDDKPDERLLVVETEWESVLARTRREGNTLSPVLRDAYDGRPLATMNAGGASREVHNHALVVVGHITPQALTQGMTGQDLSNGFLNRFLIISVHRPQLVPWPKGQTDGSLNALRSIATRAGGTTTGEFTLSDDAKQRYEAWYTAYAESSDSMGERVAKATARAVPNLLRSALIYAYLDESDHVVQLEHINAAIALVENSMASAQLLLAPGRAGLDGKILRALKENGEMTRTEINGYLGRHATAAELSQALDALTNSGEIVKGASPTQGRPATVYRVAAK